MAAIPPGVAPLWGQREDDPLREPATPAKRDVNSVSSGDASTTNVAMEDNYSHDNKGRHEGLRREERDRLIQHLREQRAVCHVHLPSQVHERADLQQHHLRRGVRAREIPDLPASGRDCRVCTLERRRRQRFRASGFCVSESVHPPPPRRIIQRVPVLRPQGGLSRQLPIFSTRRARPQFGKTRVKRRLLHIRSAPLVVSSVVMCQEAPIAEQLAVNRRPPTLTLTLMVQLTSFFLCRCGSSRTAS